ncbi:MAG: hypothetical protein ACJ0PY_05710 [Flavobacteriaceae bacterium]|tara:strand:+ start:2727 stop:4268 length:1542 start_codon:yes stop_codon:yes gene_type:complete
MDLPNNFKLLDCSLRDGGYYTNWDFEQDLIECYQNNIKKLPFDYIEIGYRNITQKKYRGSYFYTPISILKKWSGANTDIVLMIDEINTPLNKVEELVNPCSEIVKMFRIAAKPNRIEESIKIAKIIKKIGFKVCLNVMYLSEWDNYSNFFSKLNDIEQTIDYLYMADSYGSVLPHQIESTIHKIRSYTNVKLGFHGHNNLELGLINALKAIENGVELIDCSISGMGRGAGNLKTELILTYLDSLNLRNVNFENLNTLVVKFESIRDHYNWGNNLAYMVSGANSIAQKEVMNLINKRYYTIDNAIKYLGFKNFANPSKNYPRLTSSKNKKILIIGGGSSVIDHLNSLNLFIKQNPEILILFASARFMKHFSEFKGYNILVGAEGKRLEENMVSNSFNNICILPSKPNKIEPFVSENLSKFCVQLSNTIFSEENCDSHLAVTLQACIELGGEELYLIGFDGYSTNNIQKREVFLMKENQLIFDFFKSKKPNVKILSLTPTVYREIEVSSLYTFLR